MGNRRHKKASKSVLERSTVEKGTEDSNDKELTQKPSNSNDEDITGDTAEVSEKTNSKSDVSAATKEVTEDDDNNLPNELDKSCVNNYKSNEQESHGVEVANDKNGLKVLDEIDDESKENELEVDIVKNIENISNEDTEAEQQAPILRLVAIEKLLKPEFKKKDSTTKASTSLKSITLASKLTKTSSRSRKSISYVEISDSSENECDEIIDSSSENEEGLRKQSATTRKNGNLNSKENNSTNNILNDGKSKNDFNNTTIILPSKAKLVKSFSLNIEKMPINVNKLMKVYKLNDKKNNDELVNNSKPLDIWSESDDFENMISTSKIEKKSSDAEKDSKRNNCEKEKFTTRATRFNKTNKYAEMLNDSKTKKRPNIKGLINAFEVTTRRTRNSDKRDTTSQIETEKEKVDEEPTTVIDNSTSKGSIRNQQSNIKDFLTTSKSIIKTSVDNVDDYDNGKSDDNFSIEKESVAPETRNKKKTSPKKLSNESEDSDSTGSNISKIVQKTKEVSKSVSSSDSSEEIAEDEPTLILGTRMRSREKFGQNPDFITLKQTIEERKKRKLLELESKPKSKSTDKVPKFKIPFKTENKQEITPKTENTEITETNAKKNIDNNPNADVKTENNVKDNDSIVNSKI